MMSQVQPAAIHTAPIASAAIEPLVDNPLILTRAKIAISFTAAGNRR